MVKFVQQKIILVNIMLNLSNWNSVLLGASTVKYLVTDLIIYSFIWYFDKQLFAEQGL